MELMVGSPPACRARQAENSAGAGGADSRAVEFEAGAFMRPAAEHREDAHG